MSVNSGYAHASDLLFTTSIAAYALAMVTYAGEYAFGRRGRVAATAPQRVLVPAGPSSLSSPSSLPPADQPPPVASGVQRRSIGDRLGRTAVAITVLGVLIHGSSILLRGLGEHRLPWG
jgi:hypothetical protein